MWQFSDPDPGWSIPGRLRSPILRERPVDGQTIAEHFVNHTPQAAADRSGVAHFFNEVLRPVEFNVIDILRLRDGKSVFSANSRRGTACR